MAILYNFLVGFIASVIGTIPPGLLNLYAVKVNIREGRKKALIFSIGICVSVAIYSLSGLLLSRYIGRHPEVVDFLQKIALVVFIGLTVYFLFFAKDTRRAIREDEIKSKTKRFFNGILVGFLNLLIFPYWIYISLTFSKLGWLTLQNTIFWFTVFGAVVGTFVVLWGYVSLSKTSAKDKTPIKINYNLIIGIVTGILAGITLGKIMKWM